TARYCLAWPPLFGDSSVPVQDLASGHEHHPGKLADVVKNHIVVLDTMRHASDVGVRGNGHDASALSTFLIECVKVITGTRKNLWRAVVLDEINRNVIDLHCIGNGDERATRHLHAV